MADPVIKTFVKKVFVGVPVRKVTGSSAQSLNDLTDVTLTEVEDMDILQYNTDTQRWINKRNPIGLTLNGGTF